MTIERPAIYVICDRVGCDNKATKTMPFQSMYGAGFVMLCSEHFEPFPNPHCYHAYCRKEVRWKSADRNYCQEHYERLANLFNALSEIEEE